MVADIKDVFDADFIADVLNERKKAQAIVADIVRKTGCTVKEAQSAFANAPRALGVAKLGWKAPVPVAATTLQWRRAEIGCREVRRMLGEEVWARLTPVGIATAAARLIDDPRPRNPYLYEQILRSMTWP